MSEKTNGLEQKIIKEGCIWWDRSERASKNVIWSALGDAQTQHPRIEVVFHNYDFANYRIVNVVEVMLSFIHRPSPAMDRIWLTDLTVWPWLRVISGIASATTTNFASFSWKFGLPDLFGHLAKTWFACFWKCFHTFTAASIFGIKPFFIRGPSIKISL